MKKQFEEYKRGASRHRFRSVNSGSPSMVGQENMEIVAYLKQEVRSSIYLFKAT